MRDRKFQLELQLQIYIEMPGFIKFNVYFNESILCAMEFQVCSIYIYIYYTHIYKYMKRLCAHTPNVIYIKTRVQLSIVAVFENMRSVSFLFTKCVSLQYVQISIFIAGNSTVFSNHACLPIRNNFFFSLFSFFRLFFNFIFCTLFLPFFESFFLSSIHHRLPPRKCALLMRLKNESSALAPTMKIAHFCDLFFSINLNTFVPLSIYTHCQ